MKFVQHARDSLLLLIGTGVGAAISLVYMAYTARLLGPVESADFFAAMFLLFLVSTAAGPLNGTVARFSSIYSSRGELQCVSRLCGQFQRHVLRFSLVAGLLGLALLTPLAEVLRFRSPLTLLAAGAVVYWSLSLNVARGAQRGLHRFFAYSTSVVAEASVRLLACVALLAWIPTAASAVTACLIASVVVLAWCRFSLRDLGPAGNEPLADAASVRRFLVPMFVHSVLFAGFQNLDVLAVKHLFGAADAGAYGAAATLARAIAVAATPFAILLLPTLCALQERGEKVREAAVRLFLYFLLIAAVPILLFAMFPEGIIGLLYGADFAAAAPILLPAAAAQLMGCFGLLLGMAAASLNRFRFLYVYGTGLLLEACGLIIWHESLITVVMVVLFAQTLTLAGMAAALGWPIRRGEAKPAVTSATGQEIAHA